MNFPDNAHAGALDLTDAEFAELDELLEKTPEPLEPMHAMMVDGFLAGIIVQPVPLAQEQWLPHVFDAEGAALPEGFDPAWHERIVLLLQRRMAALMREMAEDGWFHPYVLELDDWNPPPSSDPAASLNPVSQALMPWVAGFAHAVETFPALAEMEDEAVGVAIARLYRHLPTQTDEEREIVATLDREHPLPTLDDALDDLVVTVADLADLTREQRYKVETIRREAPKVGRNDPCPCGSGKKFKQCHGEG